MAFTQITSTNVVANTFVDSATLLTTLSGSLPPRVLYANVSNSLFYVQNASTVDINGGYVVVTGTNFQNGASVIVDTTLATAVTYANSTTLNVQVPAKANQTYHVYVVNPDGGTGIKVNGLNYMISPNYLWGTGVNSSGQLGINNTIARSSPVQIGTSGDWSKLSVVGPTFAIKTDGTLWVWGAGSNFGAHGTNNTTYKSSPTQIGTGTTWKSANPGTTAIAIKTDGTLWGWGVGFTGGNGFNDTINRSSPVQIGSGTTWSVQSTGAAAQAAIKTDGTLWLWGGNSYGQLGFNDRVSKSSPTQLGALTNWRSVCLATQSCFAIKTDGTLWSWGGNNRQTLGIGDSNHRSSPVQVGALTNWSLVSGNSDAYSAVAIKTNGTLWSWGYNLYGQLGLNTQGGDVGSPTQVGTNTNWSSVDSTAGLIWVATKTDGTLWVCGNGNGSDGQQGTNDRVDRSSPTQVGTDSNWSSAKTAQGKTIALRLPF